MLHLKSEENCFVMLQEGNLLDLYQMESQTEGRMVLLILRIMRQELGETISLLQSLKIPDLILICAFPTWGFLFFLC